MATGTKKKKSSKAANVASTHFAAAATTKAGKTASCGACVITIIADESGLTPKATDKLSDLFSPCNQGVIKNLKTRFRNECNDKPDLEFNCESTVADVVVEVCG